MSGARLGPYEILAPLGAGGMGEVYKARDTRLDRIVAIKILPAHVASDSDRRQRFEREARAVAVLQHPHICTLHDVGHQDGTDFLVMECLEGETLAHRLTKGRLALDQALTCAIEIAHALDYAHRKSIVHRDLKPANIMLTKEGTKLLDFGLAKIAPPVLRRATASMVPTTPQGLTVEGTILGTLQYMAPEQLEGKEADARTDIFALGAVIYEMLTGERAFEGKTQAGLIGAILEREPVAVASRLPNTSMALDRAIRRCLAKDPDQRWQTAADLAAEFQWIAAMPAEAAGRSPASHAADSWRATRRWRATSVGLLLVSVALVLVLVRFYRAAPRSEPVRFDVPPPQGTHFDSGMGAVSAFNGGSISPDGRKLAFTAADASGKISIWIRALDTGATQSLSATDGAAMPFWSPDSRSLGFFTQNDLKRIDIAGGTPQALGPAPPAPRGGTWGTSGVIIVGSLSGGLNRVADSGGDQTVLTTLASGQRSHRFPAFLPDGRHFLYFAIGSQDASGLFLGSLDGGDSRRIIASDSGGVYAAPGYLLFVRQGALMSQRFDVRNLRLTGQPTLIADSLAFQQGAPAFSVSRNGTLVYRTGADDVQLAWFDRRGTLVETVGQPGRYISPALSPDGKRLAVHRHERNGGDILVMERSVTSRFTNSPSQDNSNPIWSPDGALIAFGSVRNGKFGIYQKPSNGIGIEALLVESDLQMEPMSWSPDGGFLVYYIQDPRNFADLWSVPTRGDRKPFPVVKTSAHENHAQISPDGRWLAYHSDESGENFEIYVKPFPSGDNKQQVSTAGGYLPRWRRDGKELFYMDRSDGGRIMVVGVREAGGVLEFTPPRALFESGYFNVAHPTNYHTYEVSPDGQRFLIPRPEALFKGTRDTPLSVVLNGIPHP